MSEWDASQEIRRKNSQEILAALTAVIDGLVVSMNDTGHMRLDSSVPVSFVDINGNKVSASVNLSVNAFDDMALLYCELVYAGKAIATNQFAITISSDLYEAQDGIGYTVDTKYRQLGIGSAISELKLNLALRIIKILHTYGWGKQLKTYRAKLTDGTWGESDGWTSKKARSAGMKEYEKGKFYKDYPLTPLGGLLSKLRK